VNDFNSGPGGQRIKARYDALNRDQTRGFFSAWGGWVLDGMDSFIYALALVPAMKELLPASGYEATPGHVAFAGSVLFAVFLLGWGLSFVWGPLADRFGRASTLAASIGFYAVFTGAAALAHDVYLFGLFRFLAGIGIGGEWAIAGTYVAEAWPESRRARGAGYLQTGYYAGFFLAAALNFTVGAAYGWRALFWCGALPVLVAFYVRLRVSEPARWTGARDPSPLRTILSPPLRRQTWVNTGLATASIAGLWAGSVYVPSAIGALAKPLGYAPPEITRLASLGSGLLSIATIIGCLIVPVLADRLGRRRTHGLYFGGMAVSIVVSFGWAFYLHDALWPFMASLPLLGFFGGNFAMYSLWLPEQYATPVRATAFSFVTSFGRFVGAGANFVIGWAIATYGSIGMPVAATALAFLMGLFLLPMATETLGQKLPD
jgi:MFS family permease